MKAQVFAQTLSRGIDVATLRRLGRRNHKSKLDLEVDLHPSSKTVLAGVEKRHAPQLQHLQATKFGTHKNCGRTFAGAVSPKLVKQRSIPQPNRRN